MCADRARVGFSFRDLAWHIFLGCTPCSTGCLHCYAAGTAFRKAKCGPSGRDYVGLTRMTKTRGEAWTGKTLMRMEKLTEPYGYEGKRIWVAPQSDPFHESFTLGQIALIYAVMAETQSNSYLLLTKRITRMRKMTEDGSLQNAVQGILEREVPWPLPNIWAGTSVEDASALWRMKELARTPARRRLVSFQPLLNAMNLGPYHVEEWLDQALIGTEAGTLSELRTPSPDVVVAMEEQLRNADVPFFTECFPT